MAKQTTKQRANKPSDCTHEHVEPKNEGTKNAKSGKGAKDCKNCK